MVKDPNQGNSPQGSEIPDLPEKRRRGRPCWSKSPGNGYLQQKIATAETAVKLLTEAHASLQEDKDRHQSAIEVYGSGISAADEHLAFLLVSRCAFSRKTQAVLRLEEGNQASLPLCYHTHGNYESMTEHAACMVPRLCMVTVCTVHAHPMPRHASLLQFMLWQISLASARPTWTAPMWYPLHMQCHSPMQASITALPPPDQWNDHVLAYLRDIGVDHYRGLRHNTVLKMKELLFSSMRHGLQHSCYQQLLDVSN